MVAIYYFANCATNGLRDKGEGKKEYMWKGRVIYNETLPFVSSLYDNVGGLAAQGHLLSFEQG